MSKVAAYAKLLRVPGTGALGIIPVIAVYLFLDTKLLTLKTFDRSQIRKLIGIQSFLRYSLVPVMLFSIIGILPSFLLIIIPIVWYILFIPFLGEKLFKLRM